jgi:hypothetical protein
MALTSVEEAQTRALIAQNAALLSLAGNEPTIISKLAATKVSLAALSAATSLADADLLLVRQGTTEKSVSKAVLASSITPAAATDTAAGIVELATIAEAQAGTDATRAVTPAGLFSVTGRQLQSIGAVAASNAVTVSAAALTLQFRSTTLTSGAVTTVTGTPANLVIPSGATLGTISGQQSDIVVIALNNAGTLELAVVNFSGGNDLSEMGVISTTAISAGSSAANVIYSTTARTSVAYRVIGLFRSTQTTAGTWAAQPTLVQGAGGNALDAMASLGYGQTWQDVTGSRAFGTTYYNTTGKPITCFVSITATSGTTITTTVGGVAVATAGALSVTERDVWSFVVPPGQSYVVSTTGADTLSRWSELR